MVKVVFLLVCEWDVDDGGLFLIRGLGKGKRWICGEKKSVDWERRV